MLRRHDGEVYHLRGAEYCHGLLPCCKPRLDVSAALGWIDWPRTSLTLRSTSGRLLPSRRPRDEGNTAIRRCLEGSRALRTGTDKGGP